jgi:hypothetical protein
MKQFPEINIMHYTAMKPWTCVPDSFFENFMARPADYTPLCLVWQDTPSHCNSTIPDIMSVVGNPIATTT